MTVTASFSGGGKLSSRSFRKAKQNQNQKQPPSVNGSAGDSSTSNLPSMHHQRPSPRGSKVGERQHGTGSPRRVPSTNNNPTPTSGARRGRPERFVPPSVLILDDNNNNNNSNGDSNNNSNGDNDRIGPQPRERSLPPPRTRPLNDVSPSTSAALASPTSAPVLRGARRRVSATNSSAHNFRLQQRQHQQQRRSASMDHTPSGSGRLEQKLHNLPARYSDPRQADGIVNVTRGENGGTSASATVRSDPPKKRQPISMNTGGVHSAGTTNGFRASASKCSSVGVSPRGSIGRRKGGTPNTVDTGADSAPDTYAYVEHVPKMYQVHVTRHPGDDHTIESDQQSESQKQQRQSSTGKSRSLEARVHNFEQTNGELAQYQPQLGGCPGLDLFGSKNKQKMELAEKDRRIEQVVAQREAMATENATLQDTLVSIGHRVLDLEEGMKRAAIEQEHELEEARLASERRAVDELEREITKAHADAEYRVARLEFERDEALGEIDRLRDELDEAIALSEDYEKAKSAADAEIRKYRQGFEDATSEIAALEAERDDLQKGEELLLARLKVSTDKIKALIETNSALGRENSKLQEKIESETIDTDLEVELEDAKKRISELEDELANESSLTNERLGSENVSSTDADHLDDAQKEIAALKDEVLRLKGQEGVLRKEKDDFQEGSRELDGAKERILMLEQEKSKSEVTIQEMKQQAGKYQNEIKSLNNRLGNGRDHSPEKVQGEIESALHESNETIVRLQREKEQYAVEARDVSKQLEGAYEEISRLQDELVSGRRAGNCENICGENGCETGTVEEVQSLKKELQYARGRIDKLEAMNKSSAEDTSNLLAEANEHIHELESENVDVHDANARLQREVDDARATIAKLEVRSEINHGESAAKASSEQQVHIDELEEALKRATEHISKLHLVVKEQKEQIEKPKHPQLLQQERGTRGGLK